jgi:tryptophan halogenase
VRKVGILGGGTAGWFTALALRARLPDVEVTVVESPKIPIIGVGEATVPSLVAFLHHYLDLDIVELTREVQPTWKHGIRFEWGLPGRYVFQAPFDWEANGIGMLGSMAEMGDVNSFTLQALLMARDATTVVRHKGELSSFLPMLAFAYHLDNERLVRYLTKTALARGVRHVEAGIADAPLRAGGAEGTEPEIEHLVTDDGQSLAFDLYVDCSGFRSFLLGNKLGVPFHSYSGSLFTDRAIAFNAPHGGVVKPYTTARTMDHGWCWNIPMMDDDHLGYVFSSSHTTEEQALAEARAAFPEMSRERSIHFRSGRHDKLWVGNVYAIGNAYGFVEPLESTGLLMTMRAITSLVRSFPIGPGNGAVMRFVNQTLGRDWDRLRWFLAVHYKFNQRKDTPFWRDVRAGCDVSGLQEALDLYRACGPLSLLPRAIRDALKESVGIFFYGLAGLDNILLGQKVPYPAHLPRDKPDAWRARRQMAMDFARRAVPQAEALKATWERPDWLQQLVDHPSSWVTQLRPYL